MMGIQQPATTYYDPGSMQHLGMHGDHSAMAHTTRAHPQTVSLYEINGLIGQLVGRYLCRPWHFFLQLTARASVLKCYYIDGI